MPELPEVETVRKQLERILVGKTILKVLVKDPLVVDSSIPSITPFSITSVQRRGKWLAIHTNKDSLLIHLRMTGHFHYTTAGKKSTYTDYTVGSFYLDDGSLLTHHSIRRFGRVLRKTPEEVAAVFARQGPEPFDVEAKEFVRSLQQFPRANVKNKLLDQTFLAGIGNIYAQEALYHARINPLHCVRQISTAKLRSLHHHLVRILQLSIENNGTTVYNYGHLDGKGDFQHLLAVYTKEQCPRNHPVKAVKIAGRGTYYCPQCQK